MDVTIRRYIPILIVFSLFFLLSSSAAASYHTFGRRGLIGLVSKEKDDESSLTGVGAVPPTCRLKCGKCEPCKEVYVPIPPVLIASSEYYPEAWRCKCGNQLFIP